jgi:hypothetical protein
MARLIKPICNRSRIAFISHECVEITCCNLRIDHQAIARLILTSIITAQEIVFRRSEGRYHAFCKDGKIIDLAVSGLEPGILTQAIFSMGSMAGNFVIL